MPDTLLRPIFTPLAQLIPALQSSGYAVLKAADVGQLTHCELAELDLLRPSWEDLPQDRYLKDGGHYRRRRHSCFIVSGPEFTQTPHRAHWQPVEYNALHGGMHRMFEPIVASTIALPAWPKLLCALGAVFSQASAAQPWYVEAHQFRIDTTDGIGRPTPEGAHRDGVNFVAVLLVGREHIIGGESRVFDANGSNGKRFTLTEPWTLLMLDDERVIHESTPIQPTAEGGHRDTLVLTFRAGGFPG